MSEFTYQASPSIPREVVQVQWSVNSAPQFHHGHSSTPEALTWPAHKSFVMSVLCCSADLVETYQTSHRPNIHRRSNSNRGQRLEIVDDRLWCPNLQRSVQVLRYLGTEESYGMLILGGTAETIGTSLLPSQLSLCGGHPDPRYLPAS